MKRHAASLLAILVLGVAAQAEITITPSEPTTDDEIQVTVSRWTSTGGYAINGMTFRMLGDTIYVDIFWRTPGFGEAVTQATVLHEETESLGKLAAGVYKVLVTHRGLNALTESASFAVSADQNAEPDPVTEPACDCICHRWPQFFAGRVCPLCGCSGEEEEQQPAPAIEIPSFFNRPQNLNIAWPW